MNARSCLVDFPVLSIPKNALNEHLTSRNFILLRKIDQGLEGLAFAICISYVENLILAQGTLYNNFYFFEPL